jgi:hypothetical protein
MGKNGFYYFFMVIYFNYISLPFFLICVKVEDNMSKSKGRRDVSPDKKPGPLTKKDRAKRKKERKGRHKKI